MTEKDLGKALLQLDAGGSSGAPNLHQPFEQLQRRNKRWVRLLTGVAIVFSLLAVFGVFMLFWTFHYKLFPIMQQVYVDLEAPESVTERDAVAVGLYWMFQCWWVSLACVAIALVGLMFAGISTVWLILVSRRATVRYVNARLIEISEQLKQLQPATDVAPGGPS